MRLAVIVALVLAGGLAGGCPSSEESTPGPVGGAGAGGAAGTGGTGDPGGSAGMMTGGTGGSAGTGEAPAWQTVFEKTDLGGVALSIWGTSPSDVYAVGGALGVPGINALAVRFDGTMWRDLAPGGTASFWWVSGTGPKDVWMVGEKGRITHWDGTTFREDPSGTTATLFGVWASSPTDAWAVGGTVLPQTPPGPNDVVLHWDGKTWSKVDIPKPQGAPFFKVWGSGADDVYIVGAGATIWHRAGGVFTQQMAPGAQGTLLTVGGCSANEVYAVGDMNVFRSDGASWTKLNPALTSRVNGVACNAPGDVLLVGFGGLKQRLVAGKWIDEFSKLPFADLHGAWADGTGTYWAAGGDFAAPPSPGKVPEGVIARYGKGKVSTTLVH